jgi:hypothetical protein
MASTNKSHLSKLAAGWSGRFCAADSWGERGRPAGGRAIAPRCGHRGSQECSKVAVESLLVYGHAYFATNMPPKQGGPPWTKTSESMFTQQDARSPRWMHFRWHTNRISAKSKFRPRHMGRQRVQSSTPAKCKPARRVSAMMDGRAETVLDSVSCKRNKSPPRRGLVFNQSETWSLEGCAKSFGSTFHKTTVCRRNQAPRRSSARSLPHGGR